MPIPSYSQSSGKSSEVVTLSGLSDCGCNQAQPVNGLAQYVPDYSLAGMGDLACGGCSSAPIVYTAGMQGFLHVEDKIFDTVYPKWSYADTNKQAADNISYQLNHNYNYDQNGTPKFTFKPTSYVKTDTVFKVLTAYQNVSNPLQNPRIANYYHKGDDATLISQVALNTKVSNALVKQILDALYYQAIDVNAPIRIAAGQLYPNGQNSGDANVNAAFALSEKAKELAAQEDQANQGFFERTGRAITDIFGAGATVSKGIAIAIPITILGVVGAFAWKYVHTNRNISGSYKGATAGYKETTR